MRVEVLAVVGNIVPRQARHRLPEIIEQWNERFSTETAVDIHRLREITILFLQNSKSVDNISSRPIATATDQLLSNWTQQLLKRPEWCFLPSVIPGESPTPIDDVFVELLTISGDDLDALTDNEEISWTRRRRRPQNGACVAVPTMIARTLEQCIVMGEPGSGKSTLVQWLARYVSHGKSADFDLAILIRLSAFAKKLATSPALTLIGYFVQFVDPRMDQYEEIADEIRHRSRRSRRVLLLLDGWDEVPQKERLAVQERIRQEQSSFIAVVTSRPTGLPRQLGGTAVTDYYSIAGLSPASQRELVRNHLRILRRPDLYAAIQQRIDREPDWKEMTTNPFLLGLLLRVLVRTELSDNVPGTLAGIYEQIIGWTIEQYEQLYQSEMPLTADHLKGLERLSYGLLLQRPRPTYSFQQRDLIDSLEGAPVAPVLRSRLVHRQHPVYDEFGCLHATFLEYFAASFGCRLPESEFEQLASRAFFSNSRFIILEFIAGRHDWTRARLQEHAQHWLNSSDRFGRVKFRVARLVIAGRWASDPLGRSTSEALWQELMSDDDTASVSDAIHALMAIDADAFGHRVRATDNLAVWSHVSRCQSASDLLLTKVPLKIALRDPPAVMSEMMTVESVSVVGAFQISETATSLGEIIRNPGSSLDLRDKAVECLCGQTGRFVTDMLVDIVTGTVPVSEDSRKRAARALGNTNAGRQLLDVEGRDRLILFLSQVGIENACLPEVLRALMGHPIREGAEIIAELAVNPECNESLRIQAIQVLTTAVQKSDAAPLIMSLNNQLSPEIARATFELAVRRRFSLDFHQLFKRICDASNRMERHRLVKLYLEAMPESRGENWEQAVALLNTMLTTAYQAGDETAEELAKAISSALPQMRHRHDRMMPPSIRELSTAALVEFERDPQESSEGHLLLAVAIADFFHHETASEHLKRALDASLLIRDDPKGHSFRRMRLSSAICECLTRLAPEILLSYPDNCEPVRLSLHRMTLERGCLIYHDRILDHEGQVIARTRTKADHEECGSIDNEPQATGIAGDIRLGAHPEQVVRLLRVFYFIGLEFIHGATSMNDVAKQFELRNENLPQSKSGISKACGEIQEFFDLHDHCTEPLFRQGKIGLPISGLTDRGSSAWGRTRHFLQIQGIIEIRG